MHNSEPQDVRSAANQLLNQLRDDRLSVFQKLSLAPLIYYSYRAYAVGMYFAFYVLLVAIASNLFNIWLLRRPKGRKWAAPIYVGGFYVLFPGIACFDDLIEAPSLWFICGGPMMAALTMGKRAVKVNLIASIGVVLSVALGELVLTDMPVRAHPDAAIWRMRLFVLFVISGFGLVAAWRSYKLSGEIQAENQEIDRARDRTQAAAASKTDFLATMSHEIRTPMNGILGTAQHLLGSDLDQEEKEYSRVVLDAGHKLMDVLNAILDLSKMEANQFVLRDTPLRLDRVFKDVCQELRRSHESHPVELSFTEIKQPTLLQGDPSRIEQVLRNLLMTIMHLADGARIEVELKSADATACIEVRVPGLCLDPKSRSILEDPKSALGTQPDDRQRLALVMSVSRDIIALMGGSLEVHADETQGTITRWLFFCGTRTESSDLIVSSGTNLEISLGMSSPHHVLVVDDNEINRRVARMQLEQLGCTVSLAKDGSEAVEMSKQATYSVIFMDLSMPKRNGREATRDIRSSPGPNADTPIIAFTADAYDADLESLQAAGMNGHLSKPFRVAALTRLLNELDSNKLQRAS